MFDMLHVYDLINYLANQGLLSRKLQIIHWKELSFISTNLIDDLVSGNIINL